MKHSSLTLPMSLRRVVVVLGFAVGGWVFSAVLGGVAAASESADAPPGNDPACSVESAPPALCEADGDEPRDRQAEDVGPAEDGAADTDDGTGSHAPADADDPDRTDELPAEYTLPAESGSGGNGPVESAPSAPNTGLDEEAGAEDTGADDVPPPSRSPGDPAEQNGTGDRDSGDTPSPDSDFPAAEATGHSAHGFPLLHAATDTLVATSTTLLNTTKDLTGLVAGALPQVTAPVSDVVEDVVEAPGRLPDLAPGLGGVVPDIPVPDVSIGLPDVSPALPEGDTAPAEPGAPRTETPEPVTPAPPQRAPALAPSQTGELPGESSSTVDSGADTDGNGTEAGERSHGPLGPVIPSSPSPASSATPANVVASPQDNIHSHRGDAAVLDGGTTPTQLRLLGTSRDHDVDGTGREAALPTTSPD